MRRTGPTSIITRKIIDSLRRESRRSGAPAWAAVAEILSRPSRRRVAVNISKINRYAREGDYVVVPGKVLGAGVLEKKVTIAALSFSMGALEKIKASGSRAITIAEALRENPEARRVRIIV